MAGSRSRSSNADKEAGGTSSATTSKSTRSSRRTAAAAAAAVVADGSTGHSRTGTPDVHDTGDTGTGHSGTTQRGSSNSSSSASNKPSGLETNTITYKANEFLAGLSSAANPVRRELAIELLGKPTVVAIETHGLLNQPLVGTMPVNGNSSNNHHHNNGTPVTIPPGMALTSSGLITSTASSAGCGAAALVAAAAVVAEQPNIAATAEIEDLPVDALRRYKAAYKIPQLGAQSFNGYLLNSAVGRKTWSYRIGKSNNRVPKATLAQAVRRNFGNHSVRESDVIVDFIYSVKTQENAFKCRFI
ncbi:uncharacterized protein SAPINGB_P005332 [Magnusiomyces paraingens]|uniref:Histone deacetylase complex subunit SAP30 Sin3 binding domain-containing protein n=1 Tax=Magnusiomyces paraingens TaxID=2606893 RepID=A0A5E8C1T2_9ASCO|nr:uncharacterized protein SAPINGB_P005332 [Saprochaete ingens]VVT56845.1 unnamed protein product [Saprochaete ingens]